MSYFPMFIELKGRRCLVAGGGNIALHKIKVLMDFGASVTVVSPDILPEIKQMELLAYREKRFHPNDLNHQQLVVAATDDGEENHRIAQACKERNLPVNAVDQIEDCSFIFPSYIKKGEVVAAFSSGGQSPLVTQYLKAQMQPLLTDFLAKLAERLGDMRESVHKQCKEEVRKMVYQEILSLGLEKGSVPSDEEIRQVIEKFTLCNPQT